MSVATWRAKLDQLAQRDRGPVRLNIGTLNDADLPEAANAEVSVPVVEKIPRTPDHT